jgi:hypothetical protein
LSHKGRALHCCNLRYGARVWTEFCARGCYIGPHACSLEACDQQHSVRESIFLPVDTVNYVATLKDGFSLSMVESKSAIAMLETRFAEVTLPFMTDKGATRYAWLLPVRCSLPLPLSPSPTNQFSHQRLYLRRVWLALIYTSCTAVLLTMRILSHTVAGRTSVARLHQQLWRFPLPVCRH